MRRLILYLIILSSLISCEKKEFTPNINSNNLTIRLVIDSIGNTTDLKYVDISNIKIQAFNKNKDYNLQTTTNDIGEATFSNLEPGVYDVTLSHEIKKEEISIILNGNMQVQVTSNNHLNFPVNVNIVQNSGGGFVIREFYYSGCLTPAGNLYADDQYVEIYNNGPDTLYADKILFVELESYGQQPNYWDYMVADSIVVKTIWALPESNTRHPVAPGEGYIMARDPLNHKSDPNGNPNSPVNLANANFDFWSDKSITADIDYPPENMVAKLWTFKGNDIAFHTRGGSAIAIIENPEDIDNYIAQNLVTKGIVTESSFFFCKIPNKWVIDAVEVTWNDKLYKRFDNSLDAGSTFIAAGAKSGLCIRRKIKRFFGERAVYEDTNNSTNDFEHDVVPKPREYN